MQPSAPGQRPPIAQNLRAEFERTGLTIVRAARHLDVSERQINRWRRDTDPNPGWDMLVRIAELFGRDAAWFYQDHSDEQQQVAS